MSRKNTSNFMALCPAILDWVRRKVEKVVILVCGRPVTEPSPVNADARQCPQKELEGTVVIAGDVMDPVLPEESWESLKR